MTPEGKGHNMRPAGDLELRWYGLSLLGKKLSTCSVDESQVVPTKWAVLIQLDLGLGPILTEIGKDHICSSFQMLPFSPGCLSSESQVFLGLQPVSSMALPHSPYSCDKAGDQSTGP